MNALTATATCRLFLLLVSFSTIRADCRVGDVMYSEGHPVGQIGLECINETHYDGIESFCRSGGEVVDEPMVSFCDDSVPFCVQCGPRQWGGALCLSEPEVPDYCANVTLRETEAPSESEGCLVGDIMYSEGDPVGQIGLECINETHYDGIDSFCRSGGEVVDEPTVSFCPDSSPACVQCGPRQWGGALCLSEPEVPDYCANVTLWDTEAPSESGGCLVGDIMYSEGESLGQIGLECINETHYDGIETFCRTGGFGVDEAIVSFCDDSAPFCVQCGPRQGGGALCLSEPEVPDYCENVTLRETFAPSESEGCLVGDIMYREGEPVGQIGLECMNETHYDGIESFCMSGGEVVDEPIVSFCPDSAPACVQCGPRQRGGALCLSKPEVPDYCANVTLRVTEAPSESEGCLAGDIMYREGESLGQIRLECINETHYDGIESVCMSGGEVVDEPIVSFCDDSVPFCVQCGPRQWGGALCLSEADVPNHCANVTIWDAEAVSKNAATAKDSTPTDSAPPEIAPESQASTTDSTPSNSAASMLGLPIVTAVVVGMLSLSMLFN